MHQLLPFFGQHLVASLFMKQRRTNVLFQSLHLHTDGRWRTKRLQSGTLKAAVIDNRHEGF